jgi:endonuclease VIII
VPEGDTLQRTAAGLRPHLLGRTITAARARAPGPRTELLIGRRVTDVQALGKHLLIRLDSGLEVRTHLGMHGSWHRYAPGEHWRRPASRARLVLEVPGAVAVCFDAPVVELFETRAERVHPVLSRLGPDLLADDFDGEEALRRLRDPARRLRAIGEALLDQGAMAGIGNVYKNEVLWIEGVDPFAPVARLDDATLGRLVGTARQLLLRNRGTSSRTTTAGDRRAGGSPLWIYGRSGRPCRRCGTAIAARRAGERPRVTYWCPGCQTVGREAPAGTAESRRAMD